VKHVQTFVQRRRLAPDERALVTVSLLRGPQPAGALKTRTERLVPRRDWWSGVQAVERATMVRRRVWGRSSTSATQASRSAAWCGTHFTGLVSRTETAPAHRLPRFTSFRPQRHASSGADDAAHP